jgi:ABC-type sugar transport system substrate-binding protein
MQQMSQRRVGIAVATVATLCVALTSCANSAGSQSSNGEKTYKINAAAGPISDPFWQTMKCGAEAAAKDLAVTLDWKVRPTAQDAAAQKQNVDAAILDKPDAFILGPVGVDDNSLITPRTANIPSAVVNIPTKDSGFYEAVVGATDGGSYAEIADMIIKQTSGTGTVALSVPFSGNPVLEGRYKAVVERIRSKAPNLKVLEPEYSSFDTNKAAAAVGALIVAHPDLKAVYGVTGPDGIGALSAVKAAGKQKEIEIYTFDATPEAVAALKDGSIAAVISQAPGRMAKKAIEDLVKYLKSKNDPNATDVADPQVQSVPSMLLTAANVDSSEAADFLYRGSC